MRLPPSFGILLLALACQGEFIDNPFPGTHQPPTTNGAFAFRFGGAGSERIADVVSDPAGDVYVTGSFCVGRATALPAAGPTLVSDGPAGDGFLLSLDGAGDFGLALPIGGLEEDAVRGVAVASGGNITVAGT